MHLLRSRLFSILVAAFVLVGYAEVVRGSCKDEQPTAVSAADGSSHSHSDGQGCHCICHQTFVNDFGCPDLPGTSSEVGIIFAELADIPPDAIPIGIDHPPQRT